jgi:hypothetical protein
MITTRTLLFAAATALAGCGASSAPTSPPPPPAPAAVAPAAPVAVAGGGAQVVDSEPAPGQPRAKAAPHTGPGPNPAEVISETKRLRDRSRHCITVAGQLRTGRVMITIGPDGNALRVELKGHLQGTPEGKCVTTEFREFHVDPFEGEPVTVRMSISLP